MRSEYWKTEEANAPGDQPTQNCHVTKLNLSETAKRGCIKMEKEWFDYGMETVWVTPLRRTLASSL